MNKHKQIFINLPVKNLNNSISFFKKLGFTFDPQFTDQKATCMIIGDNIFVMLLVEDFFRTFTKKQISDSAKNTEVILAITAESRKIVDDIANKALAAGAKASNNPYDLGWMYGRSFQDPDEHLWEVIYMDQNAMKKISG